MVRAVSATTQAPCAVGTGTNPANARGGFETFHVNSVGGCTESVSAFSVSVVTHLVPSAFTIRGLEIGSGVADRGDRLATLRGDVMMRSRTLGVLGAALTIIIVGVATTVMLRAAGQVVGRADLSGFQEVPTLSTAAHGSVDIQIAPDESSLTYTLTYEGFDTPVLQSHIHLGRPAVNGGIMVYFCTNLAPPAGVPLPPPCPTNAGTVTGTLSAADVIGPSAQGVTSGEFAEVVDALRAEAAYANVHSTRSPSGEIRGQVLFRAVGAAIR